MAETAVVVADVVVLGFKVALLYAMWRLYDADKKRHEQSDPQGEPPPQDDDAKDDDAKDDGTDE